MDPVDSVRFLDEALDEALEALSLDPDRWLEAQRTMSSDPDGIIEALSLDPDLPDPATSFSLPERSFAAFAAFVAMSL